MRSTRIVLLAGVSALGLALVQLPPAAGARAAAMPSDFNGDGYADLAIGVPYDDIGSKDGAGAVNVLYGSRTGLTAAGDQLWSQASPGVKGRARRGDGFGAALASGDFDRDGYADLAIGVRKDRKGEETEAGAVNVLYGARGGLTAAGDQRWAGERLAPAWPVYFGTRLASGDFNGDGFWDLAIVAPEGGVSLVLPGGPDGLTAAGAVAVPTGGAWGLAAGDLNGDGYADLAAGVGGPVVGGSVAVYFGSSAGLTTTGSQLWNQASPGIEDDLEYEDAFGAAVAIGDLDADGFGDLAIGVPGEALDSSAGQGRVVVIHGGPDGPTAEGGREWHEDVPGMPPAAGRFGEALATGDVDGDGFADLAVGVPLDRVNGVDRAGSVVLLYGGRSGLDVAGVQLWSQASPGVPGTREAGDYFGATLATADYGRSGRDDLAIGVPGEDAGGHARSGAVTALYGRLAGLSPRHAQRWSQDTPGVCGTAQRYDFFGSSLTP